MPVRTPHLILAASALLLAGCSGSGGLTTAALTGGGEQPVQTAVSGSAPTVPPPSDPTSRAVQVGATSARAVRCGFYFDPEKLKANFIAAEMAQGAGPEQLQKVEREYEFIRLSVAKKISEEAGYCDKARTNEIKEDLNRHLAGDYSPRPKKQDGQQGLFAGLFDEAPEKKKWKADEYFDDLGRTPAQR